MSRGRQNRYEDMRSAILAEKKILMFIVDPDGRVIARVPAGLDHILCAECDFRKNRDCHVRKHFLEDRRPEVYYRLGIGGRPGRKEPW